MPKKTRIGKAAGVIQDESTMVVKATSGSELLKLPAEVKQKIWTLAVYVDKPVKPVQIRDRSYKFFWAEEQVPKRGHSATIEDTPLLAAVALSKTCRALYEEVSLTHLFYKVNHFELPMNDYRRDDNATYLVAITTPRMQSIQSITCDWPAGKTAVIFFNPRIEGDFTNWVDIIQASKLFTVLAVCGGLQHLTVVLRHVFPYFCRTIDEPVKVLPGFEEALIAVEGLQTFDLVINDCFTYQRFGMENRGRAIVDKVSGILRERMKQPRGTTKYKLATFLAAQNDARLDIIGAGRLGEDRKPGVISSRTRLALRKSDSIAEDGTVPRRVIPKYDLEGMLTSSIISVSRSRKPEMNGHSPGVELYVKYRSPGPVLAAQVTASWEDITVLGVSSRSSIVKFYENNPDAYEAVLETWNLQDLDSEVSLSRLKRAQGPNRRLTAIIQLQSRIERQQQSAAETEAKRQKKLNGGKAKSAKLTSR